MYFTHQTLFKIQKPKQAPMSYSLLPLYISFLSLIFLPLALSTTPRSLYLVSPSPVTLRYHSGTLLTGNLSVNLLWYGHFTPLQRSILSDFILSLSEPSHPPSVSSWFHTTSLYSSRNDSIRSLHLTLGHQIVDTALSLKKSLSSSDLTALAKRLTPHRNSVSVVLTGDDITVDGFCMSRCGHHGSVPVGKHSRYRFPFIWVGNSVTQCPGECAWPFHQPMYGPQTPPLIAPNGDAGIDGMIINLATLLPAVITNPYGDGYFQGPSNAPLEAVTACTGVFGTGAYPGNPGQVLTDVTSGASYNAKGLAGRKYLLPAIWDPKTSQCTTLV